MNATKFSIKSLQEEARKSEDKEAFRILDKINNCRVGVGARSEPSDNCAFFIEVLVSLCNDHNPVDLNLIERKLSLLRRLTEKGYVLNCEEDGCISCELAVKPDEVTEECKAVSSMVQSCIASE